MTGGCGIRKAVDGSVQYLSLMSLAAWRGEADEGKEKEGRDMDRKLSPSSFKVRQKSSEVC